MIGSRFAENYSLLALKEQNKRIEREHWVMMAADGLQSLACFGYSADPLFHVGKNE